MSCCHISSILSERMQVFPNINYFLGVQPGENDGATTNTAVFSTLKFAGAVAHGLMNQRRY